MDKQGPVVPREDYRANTFTNDRKNQRHGIKGINGSHRTTLDRRAHYLFFLILLDTT
jgi:hypothetical protein